MYVKIMIIAIWKCQKKKIIFKYNHGEKSMKVQFIIYADMESLFIKMFTCHNNP